MIQTASNLQQNPNDLRVCEFANSSGADLPAKTGVLHTAERQRPQCFVASESGDTRFYVIELMAFCRVYHIHLRSWSGRLRDG
jgi:hypothetical protein